MKSLFMNFCKWMMVGMKLLWFSDFIGTSKSDETDFKMSTYVGNDIFGTSSNVQ